MKEVKLAESPEPAGSYANANSLLTHVCVCVCVCVCITTDGHIKMFNCGVNREEPPIM